ncbi:MAG: hypothetical protein VX777_07335 [Chlamydiota bacterium]|nr:hypothetical protein [Chlamydiota bacterium]
MIRTIIFFLLLTPKLYSVAFNPYVSEEVWNEVAPYLMPDDHPIKQKLDKIFQDKRVTESCETLLEAGFVFTPVQGIVCKAMKHKKMKGYVFKIYPDTIETRVDWVSWTKRCRGAKLIRESIKKHGYESLFKVSNKWIYPLPAEPSPKTMSKGGRKNFILVAEDQHPTSKKYNWSKWRRVRSQEFIKKVMRVVIDTGAGDCVRANNIPWCKDGKVAFIDTEVTHRWPVSFQPMLEVMSPKMRKKFPKLVESLGGEDLKVDKPT